MKLSKEFKIGIFVIVVLFLSFFVINFLRGKDILNKEIELCAEFENVEGLLPAAPVNIRGFKAGSVTQVEYDRESDLFNVICSVKKEFVIPKDSKLVIYSTDIMGGKGVKIEMGKSRSEVKNGTRLEGAIEKDLIATLTESITPIMSQALEAMVSINGLVKNVDSMFSEGNRTRISTTLASVEKTMANLQQLSASLGEKTPEIEAFIGSLSGLSEQLSSILASADTSMANVAQITTSVKEGEIFELVENLNAMVLKLQDPEGTFGRMMKDDRIYDSVDSLVTNITGLVKKMQENPKKYMKISVF